MTTDDLDRMGCQVLDVADAHPMLEAGAFAVARVYSHLPRRTYRVALVIVDDEDGEQ